MSETKHTPEKWTTSQYDEHPAMIVLDNGKEVETVIAYAYDKDVGKERQIANARIIAAAPEMLAVLEKLYALSVSPTDVFGKVFNQDYYIDVDELGALIAKARGEEIPSPVFKSIADLEISESDEAKGEKQ